MSGTDFNDLPLLPMPYQADDLFYVSRNNQSYRAKPDPSIIGNGLLGGIKWAHFQIRQLGGQSGGSFSPPNTWIERGFNYASPLNDFGGLTSIPLAGRIQLEPGTYLVTGWLTGMENASMRCRLRPLTGPASPIYGASVYAVHYSWHIPLEGLIALDQPTVLIAEMWCNRNRNKAWGFGYRTNVDPEIYGSLLFLKKSS